MYELPFLVSVCCPGITALCFILASHSCTVWALFSFYQPVAPTAHTSIGNVIMHSYHTMLLFFLLLTSCFLLLTSYFLLFYSLIIIHYSFLIKHYSLIFIPYSLITIHYSLFIIHLYLIFKLMIENTTHRTVTIQNLTAILLSW